MTRPLIQINDVVREMNDAEYEDWTNAAAEREASQSQAVRADRNARLASCDWTQLSDAPVDAAVWAAYRQQLRDITGQAGFPWNVIWPESP